MAKPKIKVGILGSSGYGGAGLLRRLRTHPHAQVVALGSRQYEGQSVDACWSQFAGLFEGLHFSNTEATIAAADVVFCATPHGATAPLVKQALDAGKRVLDLSADYRLPIDLYEQWYAPHPHPDIYELARYGLVELHREELRDTQLIAVPGCNSSTVNLALAPLAFHGLIHEHVIANLIVGVSGAGRALSQGLHYSETNENVRPYKVAGTHRHTAEIELLLKRISAQGRQLQTHGAVAAQGAKVSFNPHLAPLTRGILATCYIGSSKTYKDDELLELFQTFYKDDPMVHVQTDLPQTKSVLGSDRCVLSVRFDARTGQIITFSVTDNLGRGAAGQALQNFNLMHNLDETTSLFHEGLWP